METNIIPTASRNVVSYGAQVCFLHLKLIKVKNDNKYLLSRFFLYQNCCGRSHLWSRKICWFSHNVLLKCITWLHTAQIRVESIRNRPKDNHKHNWNQHSPRYCDHRHLQAWSLLEVREVYFKITNLFSLGNVTWIFNI